MDDESELSASQENPRTDYSFSLESQLTEQMSSYESVADYPESDDELPDSSVLDRKLNNISITKIDINLFPKGKPINDTDNVCAAEKIIRNIITKRKNKIKESTGPMENSSRLDSKAANISSSNLSDRDVQRLNYDQQQQVTSGADTQTADPMIVASQGSVSTNTDSPLPSTSDAGKHIGSNCLSDIRAVRLRPQINNMLKEKGTNYKLKLYLVEAKQDSSFSKLFADLVTEKSRERLCRETEVSKCYILFFFRNIDNTYIKPEIYALTTGSAWRIVSKYADKDFTKLVERRTLRFPFQHVEYKRDSGHVSKETQTARPGHEITFSTWDYLGKLVGKRTRNIRKQTSLYAKSLNAFLTKKGKHIESKVQLSEKTLKILCKLNIAQLGCILDLFSRICSEKKTYLVNEFGDTKGEETDDPMFEMHDFMANVTDKRRIRELNESLFKVLKDSMNGIDSHIFLLYQSVEKWSLADEFRLYARPQSDTMAASSQIAKRTRQNRKKLATWQEYPSLDAVMQSLRKTCGDDFKEEWLEDVIIKFRGIEAPLKKCIFSRFGTADIGTYIYNHGVWIEIKAQYLYYIERDFVQMMTAHLLNQLPLLLPWKHPGKNIGKNYKVEEFNREEMEPKWKLHFETICERDQFDQVLDADKNLLQGNFDLAFDFQTLDTRCPQEKAAYLYRLLECNLNEDDYNAAHTLLNMIRPDNSGTQIITCDKKTPHGIELCDILVFDDSTTYLVHVKAGFDGGPIREVCSQIRNAADNIYREQTIAGGTGIIDKYWETLTKDATKPTTHENEVKMRLERMTIENFKKLFHPTREIVFVLACRDLRKRIDFSQDIPHSLEVGVADEIRKRFATTESSAIIERLIKEEYVTKEENLTNKFILEGKGNKEAFIDTLKTWDVISSTESAKKVFEALVSGLPKSRSTIAKMEIIRLTNDFERYWVGERKLQLKIYKIGSNFRDC